MSTERTANTRTIVTTAIFLMVALSIVLFWLPIVGPLIAGFVGGRTARRLDLALYSALLPSVVIALLALFSWHYIPYPLAGLLSGGELSRAILFDSLPLLVGAVLGAVLP